MHQNFINFFNLIFLVTFFILIVNPINIIHLLLIAEIMWLLTFCLSLLSSIYLNDVFLLTLGVFILGFSVIDVGIGFIISIIQKQILNTDLLDDGTNFYNLHVNQVSNNIYIPRFLWS